MKRECLNGLTDGGVSRRGSDKASILNLNGLRYSQKKVQKASVLSCEDDSSKQKKGKRKKRRKIMGLARVYGDVAPPNKRQVTPTTIPLSASVQNCKTIE